MKRLRAYIDTSVIGGVFDTEFDVVSRAFFEQVKGGRITLLLSDLLIEELRDAPQQVRDFLSTLLPETIESLSRDPESLVLRDAYIKAGVVGQGSVDDALHVAMATIARADLIVSWNFKHFVHIEKVRGFNAVNLKNGYGFVDIRSPQEVVPYE